jgi:hypothetical protein
MLRTSQPIDPAIISKMPSAVAVSASTMINPIMKKVTGGTMAYSQSRKTAITRLP